jgi:putative transposase
MKTYVYKVYRSRHYKYLHYLIDLAGEIYNHIITLHRRYHSLFNEKFKRKTERSTYLLVYRLQHYIAVRLKKTKRFRRWNDLGSQAIQDITQRVDRAYKQYFRTWRKDIQFLPPQTKKIKEYTSFTLKSAGYKLLDSNSVLIMGRKYRYHKTREITAAIKTLTVKRDDKGNLWLHFVTEEESKPRRAKTEPVQ